MKAHKMLLIGCSVLSIGKSNAQQIENNRPNILWIVSEDNSPFIGCYGDRQATTPNIDRLATEGVLYENSFCAAPVSAPSRFTLITGMYPPSAGTENMRSAYPTASFVKFFPRYLRESGYYTTNNDKKDYNTIDQPEAWDESSNTATYKNRKAGQPFFAVFNIFTTHESTIFKPAANSLVHNPDSISIPAYLPATKEMKTDWALYYDQIQKMDAEVGQILKELDESGLADNTIVFYYADNGGVLGRSKRFVFESGLRVPLVIRFPEKYKKLSPDKVGSRTDRLVTSADYAPTVLSLAGINPPDYMQGKAFAGVYEDKPNDFAFGFRGRMDERFDLVRSIRNKQYRYVRNYMPHRIYGQNILFLWLAKSMQSWEGEFKAGRLNETQSSFFKEKPVEELYDISTDPDNINNLAGEKEYADVLETMRQQNHNYLVEIRDVGFIPEAELIEISKSSTPYDYGHSDKYDMEKVIEIAEMASSRNVNNLPVLVNHLEDPDPIIRYWAATGLLVSGKEASDYEAELKKRLNDSKVYVQIVAGEALYKLGYKDIAFNALTKALKTNNTIERVQALNALQVADINDLRKIRNILADIVDEEASEYDVKASLFLLKQIDNHRTEE
ncbi:MAG: sulfatase-like hydrolase/transferase [Mediterranea sp.]|nr:sulfatase-like hydrolase/transferase [Mediterranea sp.]